MNIKKQFLAIAAMILGIGFYTTPAFAITCTEAQKSITEWPYDGTVNATEQCGTAVHGVAVADTLHSLTTESYEQLETLAKFYAFQNQAEFASWWSTTHPGATIPNSNASVPAFTAYTAAGTPLFTVIFKQVTVNGVQVTVTKIANLTAHEAGHWLDYRWEIGKVSNYPLFINNFNRDVALLNAITPCVSPTNLFRGDKGADELFICAGTGGVGPGLRSPYVGKNNLAVLDTAWPGFGFLQPKEAFAEETAIDAGKPDGGGQSSITQHYTGGNFPCTNAIVKSLNRYGDYPKFPGQMPPSVSPVPYPTGKNCPTS